MRICLAIFLLFVHGASNAQLDDTDIIFQLSKKEISVANEELSDFTVKVVNNTKGVLNAHINVIVDKDLDLISRNNLPISLKPGESVFIPFKIYVTQKAQSGKEHTISVSLLDSAKKTIAKDVCKLQVVIKKNVSLFSLVSNILLEERIDSIRIPVRIANLGNTAQKITVVNRFPSAIQGGDFHKSEQLIIAAGRDTTITFSRVVNGRMFSEEGFDVSVVGLYANGEMFSTAYVKVQNARNNRYFHDHTFNNSYDNNSISLSSQGIFSENEAYLLTGRGIIELPNGKVGYNLDVSAYKNKSYSSAMVRNTYVGYDSHSFGFRGGNVNRNLDLNLSGRGGLFYLNDTARHNQYEGGYINSNSNLFGNGFKGFFPTGEAAWGVFTHTEKKWRLLSSALYELNPMMKSRNMIIANELTIKRGKDLRFTANLNSGRTMEYNPLDNGGAKDLGSTKYSYAAGIEFSGTIDKVIINSTNYISSGYYPGTRRGALNLSERITWARPTGNNIWGGIEYSKYEPIYFTNAFLFEQYSSNMRAEIGVSEKLFKNVTLSVSPYYTMEENNAFQSQRGSSSFLRSWNVLTTINIPISEKQYVSMNAEGGFYNSFINPDKIFRFRSYSSYRAGLFNLMASFQTGTYYLGEIASSFQTKAGRNYILNITPSIQKSFLRNKLRTELGINYNNTKLYGQSWQMTGRAEYDIMRNTSFFSTVNHNRYTFINGQYTSNILQVGITKKMRSARVGSKNDPLEVFVFKDINQNGLYDKGDSVATDHLIYINDVVFMTKQDGSVIYKNLPPGEYRITLPKLKGWYAPDQRIYFDKRDRIEIALQKTGTLRGKISYEFTEFSYETGREKEGVKITAVSENGQSYVTRTSSDGSYVFFVPIGKYIVRVNAENLPPEVESLQGDQPADVVPGEIKSVNLVLNIKQRKIETKRFSSPSLRK